MVYADLAIGASNLLLGTAVGAGVSQSIFVMPRWFSSPPESLARAQADGTYKAFWIPLQAASAVALGTAFAIARTDGRRPLLAAALGLYAATWVATGVYFAPAIIRLGRRDSGLPPAEIARRGQRWLRLTWGRHLFLGVAWALTAAAALAR